MTPDPGPKRRRSIILILSVIIVLLLAVIGVLFWKFQQTTADDTGKNKETSKRIIAAVSQLYFVPTNEEPTVALIQDKSKLGNQEFFKKAHDGDYLLIYQKSKIALIYRENDDKLVNVGPINLQGQTANDQTQNKTP